MATRQVLADLVAGFAQQSGTQAAIESVGGVDAAKLKGVEINTTPRGAKTWDSVGRGGMW